MCTDTIGDRKGRLEKFSKKQNLHAILSFVISNIGALCCISSYFKSRQKVWSVLNLSFFSGGDNHSPYIAFLCLLMILYKGHCLWNRFIYDKDDKLILLTQSLYVLQRALQNFQT